MWKHSSRTHRLVIVLEVMGRQYGIKGAISCKLAFELLTVIILLCPQQKLIKAFVWSVVSLSNPAYLLVSFPHSKYHAFSDTHHMRSTLEISLHLKKYYSKGVWSSCKILNKAWYRAFNILCKKCWYFYAVFHSCNCPNLKYTLHNS